MTLRFDTLTANVVVTADATRPFRDAGLSSRRTLTRMVDRRGARPLTDPPIRAIAGFAYG